MIRLSFAIPGEGSPWVKTWKDGDIKGLASISETDLRYKYFGVSFELVIGDNAIVPAEKRAMLVDLALSLSLVAERTLSGQNATFGFTENDDVVYLHINDGLVLLSSSFNSVRGSTTREELVAEIARFLRAAYARLLVEAPGLSDNPVMRRLRVKMLAIEAVGEAG